MLPTATPARRLDLEAVFNFRDLGGYDTADGHTTAWQRVYRADGLYRLTAADVAEVSRRGIRTVVDLRTFAELAEVGAFPVEAHPVDFHHLPILDVIWDEDDFGPVGEDGIGFVVARYHDMVGQGATELVAALEVLADPAAHPVVFHCAAGKDRTGIVAAVALSLVGVPDDVIAYDYSLSSAAMGRMQAWYEANRPDRVATAKRPPAIMLSAEPDTMLRFLVELRAEHGSIEAFVRACGAAPYLPARLRTALLAGA